MLPYINLPFEYLSNVAGAAPDELKLVFLFIISYPLAGILKRIPDSKPQYKNIFIIAVSTFYLVGLFDMWSGVQTIAMSSIGAYAIAYYIKGPWMPWIGFIFLMGHMSLSHLYRKYYTQPGAIDITGAQMVLVMKLTAFCWNVHDGRLNDKDLNDQQKDYAIKEPPGFLDYAAFVLFFPSLMAGPAFDYTEYRRWIETTMFEIPPGTDPLKAPRTRKKRKIPRSGTPATMKALNGLFWIVVYLQLAPRYTTELLTGDKMEDYSFLHRIWLLHMAGFTIRTKYYGVWALTEGACILSGIGYKGVNPKTGRVDWDRLQNVNPLGVELAQNSRAYLGNWNINTNNWLRNYIYLRVTPKGKKPGFRASMATFVTSAFWHGFEPGYYLTFVLASFIQTVAKNCRRLIRPFFLTPDGTKPLPTKRYFDIASWLVTQLAFSFAVAPFFLLTFPASITVWKRVYFYCPIGVALLLGFFASPGKAILKKQLAKRGKSANVTRPPGARRLDSTDSIITSEGLQKIVGDELERTRSSTMGVPDDLARDVDEIIDEVRTEIERRQSSAAPLNDPAAIKLAVMQKIEELKADAQHGIQGSADGKVKAG